MKKMQKMEGKSETKRREEADKTVSLIQIVNKDSCF